MNSNNTKSINSSISLNECTGLNIEGSSGLVKEVFGFGGTVKSNKGDPEIIITIKFKENVNISGILIEGSMEDSTHPTNIQLFANNSSLDFSDIGNVPSTESLKFEHSKKLNLKIAKFRSVSTLTIYLNNADADCIQINNIQIYGSEADNMDFSQIKNVNP